MNAKTIKFVLDLIQRNAGDIEATARFMRDSLKVGGLKECRALILEAKAAA